MRKEKTERSATGENNTEHTLVKTKEGNTTFNPAKSKNLHETHNVQQFQIKNSKIHTNVNRLKPQLGSTRAIKKWSRNLFNKTRWPHKGL